MSDLPFLHEDHVERDLPRHNLRVRLGVIGPCGDPTCHCGDQPVILFAAAHGAEDRWLAFVNVKTEDPDALAEVWDRIREKSEAREEIRADSILYGVPWASFEYSSHAPRQIYRHQGRVAAQTPPLFYRTPLDQLLALRRAIRPVHDPRVVQEILMGVAGYQLAGTDRNAEPQR